MKAAPETGPNRSGTRYSAADKLKAVKRKRPASPIWI